YDTYAILSSILCRPHSPRQGLVSRRSACALTLCSAIPFAIPDLSKILGTSMAGELCIPWVVAPLIVYRYKTTYSSKEAPFASHCVGPALSAQPVDPGRKLLRGHAKALFSTPDLGAIHQRQHWLPRPFCVRAYKKPTTG